MGLGISASNLATKLIKKQKNPHGQLMRVRDTLQSLSYHNFPLKPGPTPFIKFNHSLSLLLSYIALLNQDGVWYTIVFSMFIQNIQTETRHSRLPQASEGCFHKTSNIPPSCTSDLFQNSLTKA